MNGKSCEHGVHERMGCVYCERDRLLEMLDKLNSRPDIDFESIKKLIKLQKREKACGGLVGRENTLRLIWKELGIK
jgi:hypothetical protein